MAVLPQPYHMQPTPTPRLATCEPRLKASAAARALAQAGFNASRHWSSPALASSTCPVAVSWPARMALIRRNSSGSIPAFAASSSQSASWAMAHCGTPKPRKAPDGAWLVSAARLVLSTWGTKYGPVAWIGTRSETVGPHEA